MARLLRRVLAAADAAVVVAIALTTVAIVALAAREANAAPPVAASSFSGKFELVPLFEACKPPRPGVTRCPILDNGHSYYALRNRLSLRRPDGTVLTAPGGMVTDLASIPAAVWFVLPPDGSYAEAATIHDDCYRTRGSFVWRWPAHPKASPFIGLTGRSSLSRAECDEVLREGMLALGTPGWQRVVIYEAVRAGGASGWGR